MSFIAAKLNYTVARVITITDTALAQGQNITLPALGTIMFPPVLDTSVTPHVWYFVIAVPGAT